MAKPKIALYWCSSCGGCEESVLDIAERLLMIADRAEIVFWPVAFDFKYADLAAIKDDEISVTLINGAVRMDEQVRIVRMLRAKSRLIFAHGTCAHLGGIYALANLYDREELLETAYTGTPTVHNPGFVIPNEGTPEGKNDLGLSAFHEKVKPLDRVIPVDCYIPGCPPVPDSVMRAIEMVLDNETIPKGTVIADKKALCDTCPRRSTMPDRLRIRKFNRLFETTWDPDRCFLAQSLVCLGPVTRGGCQARCIRGNMPCRGCFGPTDNVRDQGAKAVSFLASLVDADDKNELEQAAESIPDAAGLFYRYSLGSSFLKEKRHLEKK